MADQESWTDMEEIRPDLVEAVPIRHGMVLAGRYAIEQIIGRGGSGVVVRAHDRDVGQEVAIKIVRAELAGQRVWAMRLAREVKLARQIHHPHVCRVFDFQQADGRAFLVMELAGQGTLREEIRSGALAARPLADRIADARAVASALAAIHAADIVHRDLTPQNLLRMGDGRLVLSDFGLAVDTRDSTSSVHGGTVAYMAPEVLRGGKSSFASDIWALGVVMHELVFGAKPRWSEVAAPEMQAPALGRPLTAEERAVFEACRACAAREPARRIARAEEAGRLLTERRSWWARRRAAMSRRPLVFAAALTLIAAAVTAAALRPRHEAAGTRTSQTESPLIVPTGEPADWTDVSTVIAEVPERIHCTRLLPDQRTIRFVWGTHPRAEDIDTVTRKRGPSPLVPVAYAEGCPDVSPDGKRLVYQGHDKEGRAFAFLSQYPNGKDAVPVVPTAEPSMSSEPTWLADSQTFSFDVDSKHMGVFSTAAGRMTVLPDVTTKPFVTSFRFVHANRVFVSTVFETGETEFSGIRMPEMAVDVRFRVPEFAIDLVSKGLSLYYTDPKPERRAQLIGVDLERKRAGPLGSVRRQIIRFPTFPQVGLAFVSSDRASSILLRSSDGAVRKWKSDRQLYSIARCGSDLVAESERDRGVVIDRLDSEGRFLSTLTSGPRDGIPACSADGRVLFYLQQTSRPTIMRCENGTCQPVVDRLALSFAMSPDGGRIALVTFERRGAIVHVMNSVGSQMHEVAETETACQLGWASSKTLWVSRRRGGQILWVEIDAESGKETARSTPGAWDCTDGEPDPQSPVRQDVRVETDHVSQLRLLSAGQLARD